MPLGVIAEAISAREAELDDVLEELDYLVDQPVTEQRQRRIVELRALRVQHERAIAELQALERPSE